MLRIPRIRAGVFVALAVASTTCLVLAGSDGEETPAPAPAPAEGPAAPPGPQIPGFAYVPRGQVLPGCAEKDYAERHRGNSELKKALQYDIWGAVPAFPLEAFYIGRYEVTNAQWKHYLDRTARIEHETGKDETLRALASRHVRFRGEGIESEWKAIYSLNWRVLVEAWQKAGVWGSDWAVDDPPAEPGKDVGSLALPEKLKLVFYSHRVPQPWYGWCKLAGLRFGREYCDPTKPAESAFAVPDEGFFKALELRDADFAAHPVRSVSPNEMLAFAEWAGCQLPTEYEWERAARGDNLRWPFAFGVWDYNKQKTIVAWADNERCRPGTLRVDDGSVGASDSPFGARHMHGNVWELTRTFFDIHPRVSPEPPRPQPDITNYALIAKGGSNGDAWAVLWVCTRTGLIGENAELSLQSNNRTDSLGLRLASHYDRPGHDLLLHSIRRLSYDSAAAQWSEYVPHAFAMERADGVDTQKLADVQAPYIHATEGVRGIGIAPLWATKLDEAGRRSTKPERNRYYVLGAFRSDVPLKAGVCLSDAARRALEDERERYRKLVEAFKKLKPAQQKQTQLPPPPAEPDVYEKETAKNADVLGLWREDTIKPGEWFIVYWNGYIGLANKTLTMPPDAIALIDPKQVARKGDQPGPARLAVDAGKDEIRLLFWTWEQPGDKKKQVIPPGPEESEEWALCEALPSSFIKGGPSARPNCWEIDVTFKTEPKALTGHAWRKRER